MASTFPPRLTAATIDCADPEGNEACLVVASG
jgi:hypothetical protein